MMLDHFEGLNLSQAVLKMSDLRLHGCKRLEAEQCGSNCREHLNNDMFAQLSTSLYCPK